VRLGGFWSRVLWGRLGSEVSKGFVREYGV
jgi:hypothetical protein